MKQTIKGVIVMDNKTGEYRFYVGIDTSVFVNGVFRSEYTDITFVADHTIELDTDPAFDPVTYRLNSLDAQEKEEVFQHQQKLKWIQNQRQELLAIGND